MKKIKWIIAIALLVFISVIATTYWCYGNEAYETRETESAFILNSAGNFNGYYYLGSDQDFHYFEERWSYKADKLFKLVSSSLLVTVKQNLGQKPVSITLHSTKGSSIFATTPSYTLYYNKESVAGTALIPPFSVNVVLSDQVKSLLNDRQETITLETQISTIPEDQSMNFSKQDRITLGSKELELSEAGEITIEGITVPQKYQTSINSLDVLVIAYSSRKSSNDNLVAANSIEGNIASLEGKQHELSVTLLNGQ
jgi:hypothetical protein